MRTGERNYRPMTTAPLLHMVCLDLLTMNEEQRAALRGALSERIKPQAEYPLDKESRTAARALCETVWRYRPIENNESPKP